MILLVFSLDQLLQRLVGQDHLARLVLAVCYLDKGRLPLPGHFLPDEFQHGEVDCILKYVHLQLVLLLGDWLRLLQRRLERA